MANDAQDNDVSQVSGGPALGIDGGGSGCRAVLADSQGRIIGRGVAGPANILTDPEGALASIMAAADAALDGRPPEKAAACLGLAGGNFPEACAWLRPRLPFGRVQILHDAVTSVQGVLGKADGIVAAIGTGSVFSRQLDGVVRTIGGWGLVLGDEGSGAWLGRAFLAHALRAGDGLAAHGPLVDEVLAKMGGPAGVVAFAGRATAAEFAALAPRIIAAAPNDPAAEAVLAQGTTHVAAAIGQLQEGRDLPVAFTGGLGPLYAGRLGVGWPHVAPRGNALDGALQLAQELAASPIHDT